MFVWWVYTIKSSLCPPTGITGKKSKKKPPLPFDPKKGVAAVQPEQDA
jgi:hypothetical protein